MKITTGKFEFEGFVYCWEEKKQFGKPVPLPWTKTYKCKAYTIEEANVLLGMQARRDGRALGGVQDIRRVG